MVRKVLLVCGILSSLLYVATDVLAAMRWEGYNYASQMVSELMAIGAPTRPLLVVLFSIYNPLVVVFGIGVWLSAGRKRALRVTAILVAVYGVIGQVGLLFAPMHLRGAQASATDVRHVIATMAISLLILLFIGFGSAAAGNGFRLYSIVTILVLIIFGGLTGLQGPRLAAGLATPGFGVMERVNIYGSMLWILMLAVVLLREKRRKVPLTLGRLDDDKKRMGY